MKKLHLWAFFALVLLFHTSCQRSGGQAWEDMKTAGRYLHRSIDTLCGKDYDSQLLTSGSDFVGPQDAEFIALQDKDLKTQFTSDLAISQPNSMLQDKGVPAMLKFADPALHLRSIFQTLYFETDDHVIRNHQDLVTVQKIAQYLKKHPNTYLTIEGHTDERASAAYNMALATRRANHVRVLLIKQGVDFNRIYTISHGKEKPVALGHNDEAWKQNRRSCFKIYEKK